MAVLFLIAVLGSGCSVTGRDSEQAPTAPTVPTAAGAPPASPAASSEQLPRVAAPPEMEQAVDRLLAGEDGVYGIVITRPDGAIIYSRNCDTPFVAASLYKLILMAAVHQAQELGVLRFDQVVRLDDDYFFDSIEFPDSYFPVAAAGDEVTIDELMFATGAYSSNVAARALLSLTDRASLEEMAGQLGLANTHLFVAPARLSEWPPSPSADAVASDTESAKRFADESAIDGPVNLTTPCDVATFFSLLLAGKVVSAEASAAMLEILKQQAVNDRFPILLPRGVVTAHKTGNLEHVVHDAGVIYGPDGPVILAALSEGMVEDDRANAIIQRLALIAYGVSDVPPVA
ncbi:N/A [soil metagenome]